MRTKLPSYKVERKDLAQLGYGKNVIGICGPERNVPEKTIYIDKRLNKWEAKRVIFHELVHGLWWEDGLDFESDDQIELEALFHIPRTYLTQAERTLLKYLSNNFKWYVSKEKDLIKIRERVDKFLGL